MRQIYILITFLLFSMQMVNGQESPQLFPEHWQRYDRHDGYVIGNGQMYVISGLGKELIRKGKSQLSSQAADYNRIAWVIGPSYAVGNLGYGWEPVPILDGDTLHWENQSIIQPDEKYNFWGAQSRHPHLHLQTQDILLSEEAVFIREIVVTKPSGSMASKVRLFLPVYADPRNGYYAMFSGAEVDAQQIDRWGEACGPNLKPRASIPESELKLTDQKSGSLVLTGANHALWQEISTIVPDDKVYKKLFPYRAAATSVVVAKEGSRVDIDHSGFSIDLGTMAPGASVKLYLYIVTEKGNQRNVRKKALSKLARWKQKDPAEAISQAVQSKADFLFSTKENQPFLLQSINSCVNLITACKSEVASAMAQPYMYPMYYVRDQYGPFKLFIAAGEYEKAYEILQFYVAKQNQDGIQNAHDLFPESPDPSKWYPDANSKNGHHSIAEVPSYIILMARDYYQATGDLEGIQPLYERLKYNLQVQAPSINGVLPFAGDESYTNTSETVPKYREEMTDSHLLFLAAAEFMKSLAQALKKEDDARAFDSTYTAAREILFERMWLSNDHYFIFGRDDSQDEEKMDKRPAFDALLRWYYLEMGNPLDSIAQYNLDAVLNQLTEPIRVVPEFAWCAGMDAGYLLYALARSQHPVTHQAADLLLDYASDQGLYSEYYRYQGDTIVPIGGTLRPWESAVNGFALIQYLSGWQVDMPNKSISLQPHLPKGWTHWKTKEMPLYNEGVLQVELSKEGNLVTCQIRRKGGQQPLKLDLEFGLFGDALSSADPRLEFKSKKQDILFAKETLPATSDWTLLEFQFQVYGNQ